MNPASLPFTHRECRDDRNHPFTAYAADPAAGTLVATFRDGSTYRYRGVPAAVLAAMTAAPRDAGCLFNRFIRFARYPFTRD